MWAVPMIILGEFDAIEGPKDLSVTQYCEYKGIELFGPQFLQSSAVQGKVVVGTHAISGALRPDYKQKVREIVARILASNESSEESVVMSDPDVGGVSGIAFCLGDILARGESRRFCVIVTHPEIDELICRWPVLSCFMKVLLERWMDITEKRLALEYSTFPDLERRREEARRGPMRPLMLLLAESRDMEVDAFRRTHCFFECVLLGVFGRTLSVPVESSCKASVLNAVRQYVKMKLPLLVTVDMELNLAPENDRIMKLSDGGVISLDSFQMLKPLSVWLLTFLQGSATGLYETELLLSALLRGKQIVVYGVGGGQCASLAISLSQVLPVSLRCVSIFSEKYKPPCESRILSFKTPFCLRTLIETTKQTISEFPYLGIVCVNVDDIGHIVSVSAYDVTNEVASMCGVHSDSKVAYVPDSRIVRQFLDLFRLQISAPASAHVCRRIQSHIEQLIVENIVRGRLYTEMCRKDVLYIYEEKVSSPSGPPESYWSLRHTWHRLTGVLLGGCRFLTETRAPTEPCRERRASAGDNGSRFAKSVNETHLSSMAASCHDHEVLFFLGSA